MTRGPERPTDSGCEAVPLVAGLAGRLTMMIQGWLNMSAKRRRDKQGAHAETQAWRDVLVVTSRDLWASGVFEIAATLAFYAVLSLFPLMIVGIIATSYFADPEWVTEQAIAVLGTYLPAGEADIMEIVESAIAKRRRVGILSIVVFLATGRRILGALTSALNRVSDVQQEAESVRRRLGVELAMAMGLAVTVVLALASGPLIRLTWSTARVLPGPDSTAVRIIQEAMQVLLLLSVFALVYAIVPQGKRMWRAVLAGAGVATVLFLVAQAVFTVLTDYIWPNLMLLYGRHAAVALLLVWAWYVALVTLIGGALASHVKVIVLERATGDVASDVHQNQ